MHTIKACGDLGTDHLAFGSRSELHLAGTIGWISSLMVFRKQSDQRRLLAASTDPVSNKSFVGQIPAVVRLITKPWTPTNTPEPPSLVSPQNAAIPAAAPVRGSAVLAGTPSSSGGEVAEIVEFAYHNDARCSPFSFPDLPRPLSTARRVCWGLPRAFGGGGFGPSQSLVAFRSRNLDTLLSKNTRPAWIVKINFPNFLPAGNSRTPPSDLAAKLLGYSCEHCLWVK